VSGVGLLGALVVATASAGPLEIALTDGPLRPGRAAMVEVAGTDPLSVPRMVATNGVLRSLGEVRPNVWAWQLLPGEGAVELVASTELLRVERTLASDLPPVASLSMPQRVDAVAGAPEVRFVVAEPSLPAEALEVVAGEGRVVSVQAVEEGLQVELALDDSPFPRVVPVGVRDARTDDAPRWLDVRLRARPRLPLEAEPGVVVELSVGERRYGPFVADASGRIEAVVDQYPGETSARARLVDDLGNETFTELPLSAPPGATLVGMVAGERLPGMRAPMVFLQAARGDGRALATQRPRCQTPEAELQVWQLDDGWMAAAPALDEEEPTDLRVSCRVEGAVRNLKVPVTEGVAERVRVRVWPEDLRTDFPVAEVRVVLEDARGDRLETDRVQVRAVRGEVQLDGAGGIVARGDYLGDGAVAAGADTLVATWSAPPGDGPLRKLAVSWSPLEEGTLSVHGRALDRLGRPLEGVQMQLGAGSSVVAALSDATGFATAEVPRPDGVARVRAASGPWFAERLAPPGSALGGPGSPDLTDAVAVSIQPGLIAGVSVEVDPPILRAGPGSVAWVYVALEDRSGARVTDASLKVDVSEGRLGELKPRGDGRFVAEYTPEPGSRVRDVVVTAESDGVRSATRLSVQPRTLRVGFGPWLGWQTNLGEVSAPTVGADLDIRLRSKFVGESLMLRLGAAGYLVSADVPNVGEPLELGATMVPLHTAFLLRDDPGAFGVWVGAGGAAAMQRVSLRSPVGVLSEGTRWLVGPMGIAGVGRRLLGGEGFVEARASWLSGRTGQVGFSGNLGGVGVGLGWRVVY